MEPDRAGTDADQVAVVEHDGAGDSALIHEGTASAPEIFEEVAAIGPSNDSGVIGLGLSVGPGRDTQGGAS